MRAKKIALAVAVGCSVIGLASCGGGGGSGSSSTSSSSASTTQSTLSLSGVNQMMVAPQGLSVQTASYALNKFFKALLAGFSIRDAWAAAASSVAYVIDASGKINPSDLANLVAGKPTDATSDLLIDSPKYLLFRYQGLYKAGTGEKCVLVGVRKTDGKTACISTNPRCDTNPNNICNVSDYRSQIKVDPAGDVFTTVLGDGGLESFDLTNPEKPTYASIFTHQAVGDAAYPILNKFSDVWTRINLLSTQNIAFRIYPKLGGNALYEVPAGRDATCAFAGPDADSANFYYIANMGGPRFDMYKLTRSSTGTFSETLVMTDSSSGQANTLWMNSGGCAQMVNYGDKVYSVGYNQTQMAGHYSNFLYELMNPSIAAGTSAPVTFTLNGWLYATNLLGYDTGLVVAGFDATETTHGIKRFNPATNQLTTVMDTGIYKIISITAAKNGDITFTGTRVSDSANVIVTIPVATNILSVKVLNAQPVAIGSVN